jgi:hypothetical protein
MVCYAISIIQLLSRFPEFSWKFLSMNFENNQEAFELQILIGMLLYSPLNAPVDTTRFFQVFKDGERNLINVHNAENSKEFFVNALTKFGTWDESLRSIFLLVTEDTYINAHTNEITQDHPSNSVEIGLSLAMKMNSSLQQMIKTFFEPYHFDKNNMIQDFRNQYVEAYMYKKIVKLPEILMLELGRMTVTTFPPSKNNEPVDFEKEIDLSPFMKNHESCLYDLIGIVNHIGNVSSGHYISFFNNEGQWIEFNDSRTRNVSYEEVISLNRGDLGEQNGNLFLSKKRFKVTK